MDKKTKLIMSAMATAIILAIVISVSYSHWSDHPEQGLIGIISKLSQNSMHLRLAGIAFAGLLMLFSLSLYHFIHKHWQNYELQQLKKSTAMKKKLK